MGKYRIPRVHSLGSGGVVEVAARSAWCFAAVVPLFGGGALWSSAVERPPCWCSRLLGAVGRRASLPPLDREAAHPVVTFEAAVSELGGVAVGELGGVADGVGWRLSGVRGPTTSRPQEDIFQSKACVEMQRRRAIGTSCSVAGDIELQKDRSGILEPAFSKPRKPITRCSRIERACPVAKPISGTFTTAAVIWEVIKDVEQAVSGRRGRSGTAAGDVAFPKGKENIASVLKRYKRRLSSNKPPA